MKVVEFEGTITPSGEIALPPDVASEIPTGEQLHVVISWERSVADPSWRSPGNVRFEAAYAPEDSVYERLVDDAPIR